jgi:hypothetical protein
MTLDAALTSYAAALIAGITAGCFFVVVSLFYGRR